jgi:hypothetical protein
MSSAQGVRKRLSLGINLILEPTQKEKESGAKITEIAPVKIVGATVFSENTR